MTFSSVHNINHLYFVTASISGWKHLLAEPKYIQIVLDSLVWLQNRKRILLFAYVIMPSHLHMILKPEGRPIGEVVQDFGSYTAHAILYELRKDKRDDLLKFSTSNGAMLGMNIAFGRTFKPRIFIRPSFYFKRWNIFIITLYQKIGNL